MDDSIRLFMILENWEKLVIEQRFKALPLQYITLILALLLSSIGHTATIDERAANPICEGMLGTWFTDTTVINTDYGNKRDVMRIDRKSDGSAYLKGVSIYYDENDIQIWEFPSSWSCDGEWYSEQNEWGDTVFKIKHFKDGVTVLYDEKNNMGAPEPVEIVEKRELDNFSEQSISNNIKVFLGIPLL